MKRLAVLVTHPIQYYAPVFRLITAREHIQVKVFYTKPPEKTIFDHSFGQVVKWDIPLLEGYDHVFQPAGNQQQTRALLQAVMAWKPDAVLIFGWNPPGHLAAMRFFKGRAPVWFRGDSTLLDEQPGLRKWARRLFLRWVYRHADRAFYVGTQNKRYFLKHGLREEQLIFAPHAIDNERFADGPEKNYEQQAAHWRETLGLTPEDFTVLFAGKLDTVKNPTILLRAVQQINLEARNPIHLIFVGSGRLERELSHLANGDRHIHFIGFQNQSRMPIVYRLANVYCLPSFSETWGLAVNEAMACGRPAIVSSRVGCAVDLVGDPNHGRVFESENTESLLKCITDEMKKASDGKAERQAFIQNWSFERIAESFETELNR